MSRVERSFFSDADIVAVGPWGPDDLTFAYAPNDRLALNPPREHVERCWTSYRAAHPSAFDGQMLGLVAVETKPPTGLTCLVKPTSYAEYVATRAPAFEITHPGVERANPLGITIVIVSSDDSVVVTYRSSGADQNPGMPYFIGGYLEPPQDGTFANIVGSNATREVIEELGAVTQNVLVVGVAADPLYCHPELLAVGRIDVEGKHIVEMWHGAWDKDEARELVLLPLSQLLSVDYDLLFPRGVTWSFGAATSLLRRCWSRVSPLLEQ